MLEQYRKHVAERAAEGVVPKPLEAGQTAALIELIKHPPAGEKLLYWICWLTVFRRALMKPLILKPVFFPRLPRARSVLPF